VTFHLPIYVLAVCLTPLPKQPPQGYGFFRGQVYKRGEPSQSGGLGWVCRGGCAGAGLEGGRIPGEEGLVLFDIFREEGEVWIIFIFSPKHHLPARNLPATALPSPPHPFGTLVDPSRGDTSWQGGSWCRRTFLTSGIAIGDSGCPDIVLICLNV